MKKKEEGKSTRKAKKALGEAIYQAQRDTFTQGMIGLPTVQISMLFAARGQELTSPGGGGGTDCRGKARARARSEDVAAQTGASGTLYPLK